MTTTLFNFGKNYENFKKATSGDVSATVAVAKEVLEYDKTLGLGKAFINDSREIYGAVRTGNSNYVQNLRDGFATNWANGTTSCVRLFPSVLHNTFPSLGSIDKSLIQTNFGRGILERLGGTASYSAGSYGVNSFNTTITGGTSAQIAGRTMAKIPLLGLLISMALEIPDIMTAFKNGDGMAQVGRSMLSVAGATSGAALGAAIGTAILPGVGTVIGAFVGGWLGGKIGKGLGEMLFGKSKKDQMAAGKMARPIMNRYKNLSVPGLNYSGSVKPRYSYNSGFNYSPGYAPLNFQSSNNLINTMNQDLARYKL